MKKAYVTVSGFNEEAQQIIKNAGIELTLNNSNNTPNGEELISILEEYDIIILSVFSKLTSEMLQVIKTPKIIGTISVGLDHIDKSFFKSPLVKIVNIKTANARSVAEHIFSLILNLNKRVNESNQLVIEGKGERKNLHERPEDISGKTLGLIGCGNITAEVIKIARAFNMKLKCYTIDSEAYKAKYGNEIEFLTLDEVLEESDIINISVPLTEDTNNMISEEKIKLIKPTATFINTAREKVVDTEALIKYADLHDTFYVGLDIDVDRYKDLFNKFRKNVIVTPHIAGNSKQAIEIMDIEIANRVVETGEKSGY